jgi:pilus assembly protein Flp/PilA
MRCFNVTGATRSFRKAEDGATAIEYAIIAAGIAGAIIVTVGTLGAKLVVMWTSIASIFS